jgi:hypothetical protein
MVIAWVEEGGARPGEADAKRKARRLTFKDQLSQRLAWLTKKVSVQSLAEQSIRGLTVSNLPGAGQP